MRSEEEDSDSELERSLEESMAKIKEDYKEIEKGKAQMQKLMDEIEGDFKSIEKKWQELGLDKGGPIVITKKDFKTHKKFQ
jgi:predicted nuclease with TOPRIM domain